MQRFPRCLPRPGRGRRRGALGRRRLAAEEHHHAGRNKPRQHASAGMLGAACAQRPAAGPPHASGCSGCAGSGSARRAAPRRFAPPLVNSSALASSSADNGHLASTPDFRPDTVTSEDPHPPFAQRPPHEQTCPPRECFAARPHYAPLVTRRVPHGPRWGPSSAAPCSWRSQPLQSPPVADNKQAASADDWRNLDIRWRGPWQRLAGALCRCLV
jgi:hypothetical protein